MINYREAYIPVAAVIFAAGYISTTKSLPQESIIFPQTILTALCLFGAVILCLELKVKRLPSNEERKEKTKVPLVIGITFIFVLLFSFLGFLVAAPIYLFASLLFLRRSLVQSALVSIGLTTAIYLIFTVSFRIPL